MEAPKLPSIFKQNSPRAFGFKPRYYDARKERLEEMKKKYADAGDSAGQQRSREALRQELHQEWSSHRNKANASANIRLIVILGLLFLIAYYLLSYLKLL